MRTVHPRGGWLGLALAGVLLGSGVAQAAPTGAEGTSDPGAEAASADVADVADPAWSAYHSQRGAFSVAVPAGWTTDESLADDGGVVVRLSPGEGQPGVEVRLGGATAPVTDLPNAACGTVALGNLTGTRCRDTLAGSVLVTADTPNGTVQITAGRRVDAAAFEGVVASFTTDAPVAPPPSAAPAPVAPPVVAPPAVAPTVDRCAMTTGPGRSRPLCPMP